MSFFEPDPDLLYNANGKSISWPCPTCKDSGAYGLVCPRCGTSRPAQYVSDPAGLVIAMEPMSEKLDRRLALAIIDPEAFEAQCRKDSEDTWDEYPVDKIPHWYVPSGPANYAHYAQYCADRKRREAEQRRRETPKEATYAVPVSKFPPIPFNPKP